MTNDAPKKTNAEIFPPRAASSGVMLPPDTPAGIPLLARAKYWSVRMALKAFLDALILQEKVRQAENQLETTNNAFELTLVRVERMNDLRNAEHRRIDLELANLHRAVANLEIEDEFLQIRRRAIRARLEMEAIIAERELKAVKDGPVEDAALKISSAETATQDLLQIRKDGVTLRRGIVEVYGGDESAMSDDDRELLSQLDVRTRNRIAARLEEFP